MQIRELGAAIVLAAALLPATAAQAATTLTHPTSHAGTSEDVVYATHKDDLTMPPRGIGIATWTEVTDATVGSTQSPAQRIAVVTARAPGGLAPSTQRVQLFQFDPQPGIQVYTLVVGQRSCSRMVVNKQPIGGRNCGSRTTRILQGTWTVHDPPFNQHGPLKALDKSVRVGETTPPPLARYHVGGSFGGLGGVDIVLASVAWGDGETDNYFDLEADGSDGIAPDIGAGSEDIVAGHAYAEPGTYTVTVSMQEGGEFTPRKTTARSLVHVRSAPRLRAAPITATEGAPFSGRIGDVDQDCAGCTYAARVDWGDGSIENASIEQVTSTFRRIVGEHTWSEEGQYRVDVTVTVRDADGVVLDTEKVSGVATVDDAPLFASRGMQLFSPAPSFSGTIGHLTDANPNARATDYQVLIDWGDGRTSGGSVALAPDGGFFVQSSHLYASNGLYDLRYKVRSTRGQEAEGDASLFIGQYPE